LLRAEESKQPLKDGADRSAPADVGFFQIVQNLPVAVYSTDAAGRITFYNDAAASLWGRHPKLGQDWWCGSWRLYWPDGTPMGHDECPMAITLKTGHAARGVEAIAERPDGTRYPFLAYPTPLRNDDGQLVGAVNMLVDITERKRNEEAAQHYAAIVESSDDAIISKDVNGVIMSWNSGARRLFGYTSHEAVGKPVTILIPPNRQDEEPRILERIRRGEKIEHYETIRRRKDGRFVDISLTVSHLCSGAARQEHHHSTRRKIGGRCRPHPGAHRCDAARPTEGRRRRQGAKASDLSGGRRRGGERSSAMMVFATVCRD
jgi:PAS domain S-box-containing protein